MGFFVVVGFGCFGLFVVVGKIVCIVKCVLLWLSEDEFFLSEIIIGLVCLNFFVVILGVIIFMVCFEFCENCIRDFWVNWSEEKKLLYVWWR